MPEGRVPTAQVTATLDAPRYALKGIVKVCAALVAPALVQGGATASEPRVAVTAFVPVAPVRDTDHVINFVNVCPSDTMVKVNCPL